MPDAVQHKNLLFDFYGGLLTEKQRAFFTMHYMDDLSLAEIGERTGVTPQAAADMLKRSGKLLDGYEARMGLVGKLRRQREALETLNALLDNTAIPEGETIRKLFNDMLL